MNVYRRYFVVTEGTLIDAAKQAQETNKQARKKYQEILAEIGANSDYWHINGKLVAFAFDKEPESGAFKKSRRCDNAWEPRLGNKDGKQISKQLEAIETVEIEEFVLRKINLTSSLMIVSGNRWYGARLIDIPSDPIVLYITVPWFDADPAEVEKVRTGEKMDSDLKHLLWEPTEEMIEVKEWQLKKAVQEWNDSLKEKE